jgi:hypothetical protein
MFNHKNNLKHFLKLYKFMVQEIIDFHVILLYMCLDEIQNSLTKNMLKFKFQFKINFLVIQNKLYDFEFNSRMKLN